MTILAAYSEIALKSRYVRSRLERQLADQIKYVLKRKGHPVTNVQRRFGRLYIVGAPDEAAEDVAKVFGVASAMPALRSDSPFDSVIALAVQAATQAMSRGDTFAVRPRVVGEHPYGSREVAVEAGSAILEALKEEAVSVHLDDPDVTVYVEVRDRDSFAYTKMVKGVAGLPYGSQGRLVSLFSGGIDSPVATWLVMKRGAEVLPLFMDQRPHVGESYIDRVEAAYRTLREYAPVEDFDLYFAPMGPVMTKITESPEPRYNCVLCKRSMYRIAQAFAEKKEAKGIVTGESLGQVASQTLDNLYILDNVASIPVLRPNIGLDKVEIEDISRKFSAYRVTAKKVEGCTVVPEGPTTRARLEKVLELEEELGLIEMCRETADGIEAHEVG